MNEIKIDVEHRLKNGDSLRKISREIGIGYGTLRSWTIKWGLHTASHKMTSDGMARCKYCQKDFNISSFPNLEKHSHYICTKCLDDRNHTSQIKKLGCSKKEYYKMMELQNERCAICRRQDKIRLAVDHDHETGKIRGLLCGTCNRGLGCLGEKNLRQAIAYIESKSPAGMEMEGVEPSCSQPA